MRGGPTSAPSSSSYTGGHRTRDNNSLSQGLTLSLRHKQMNLKFGKGALREVSERKQVGDAESMVNEGRGGSGMEGVFTKGGGEF
jgi:hypothetical protein